MSSTTTPPPAQNPNVVEPAGRTQPPALQPAGPPYPNVCEDQMTPNNGARPNWQTWFDPTTGEPVTWFPGTVTAGGTATTPGGSIGGGGGGAATPTIGAAQSFPFGAVIPAGLWFAPGQNSIDIGSPLNNTGFTVVFGPALFVSDGVSFNAQIDPTLICPVTL